MKHEAIYIIYDFETGGFHANQNPATEVALIVLNNDLVELERYSTHIIPYKDLILTKSALDFTGKTEEMIRREGIEVNKVYSKIKEILIKHKGKYKKPILVGHNSSDFDINFLRYIFNIHDDSVDKYIESFMWDTLYISRAKWGHIEVDNHKLEGVCRRLNISLTDAHGAMNDTVATKEVFIHFMKEMRDQKIGNNSVNQTEYKRKIQFEF